MEAPYYIKRNNLLSWILLSYDGSLEPVVRIPIIIITSLMPVKLAGVPNNGVQLKVVILPPARVVVKAPVLFGCHGFWQIIAFNSEGVGPGNSFFI